MLHGYWHWLECLRSASVDIAAYGHRERELHKHCLVSWDWEREDWDIGFSDITLTKLECGPFLYSWRVIIRIEARRWANRSIDEEIRKVPGAWTELGPSEGPPDEMIEIEWFPPDGDFNLLRKRLPEDMAAEAWSKIERNRPSARISQLE